MPLTVQLQPDHALVLGVVVAQCVEVEAAAGEGKGGKRTGLTRGAATLSTWCWAGSWAPRGRSSTSSTRTCSFSSTTSLRRRGDSQGGSRRRD